MENIINLTPEAENAIINLQHPAGTYHYYRKTLDRLFTHVLHMSDEMGMSENEAMHTLRALDGLRFDLSKIAGEAAVAGESAPESIAEELAARVHDAFDDFEDSNYPRPLDEELTANVSGSRVGEQEMEPIKISAL